MGTFKTAKTLIGTAPYIPEIASKIQEAFQAEGYEVINATYQSPKAACSKQYSV